MNSAISVLNRSVQTALLALFFTCSAPVSPALAGFNVPMADLSRVDGVWVSRKELMRLPTSGPAWKRLKKEARKSYKPPNLSDQNDPTNVIILAKALVHVRTGNREYQDQVIDACMAAIGTERGGASSPWPGS